MTRFPTIYLQAIEQTKQKINDDIDHYLENKESLPSFEQFCTERALFLEQIWANIWMNKASNAMSKKEKKLYLTDKGYDVEGVNRKAINQLFRKEIKDEEPPFDVIEWLAEIYKHENDKWLDRYLKAKRKLAKRMEEKIKIEKRRSVENDIAMRCAKLLEVEYQQLYIYIRFYVAKHLLSDLQKNPKYQITKNKQQYMIDDRLNQKDFLLVSDFFEELTGGIQETFHRGRNYFEHETYYDLYDNLITEYLFEAAPAFILKRNPEMNSSYESGFSSKLSEKSLMEIIYDELIELAGEFMAEVCEEYVEDLLKLAKTAFDDEIHFKIFQNDFELRKKRVAEELAKLEEKRREEERIIEDVFGQEFRPNVDRNRRYVLHIGETNTGKTHQALLELKQAKSGLYLAPLRLLALEVYDRLNVNNLPCSLKTGEEEKIVAGATHISCTVEMFHEKDWYDVIVIDEAQMLADKDRGFSWFKAITKANASEVHIIGSRNSKEMLLRLLAGTDVVIREYKRNIPLKVEKQEFQLSQTKKGDALVCFSRRKVLETAAKLQSHGHSISMIYGSMPPETRKKQIQQFINGKTTTVVSTDAIGMGVNLPIRRIVFLENEKFDGTRRRRLNSQEVKQIAGRAGRKGLYEIGKVAFSSEIGLMNRLLEKEDEPLRTFAIAPTNTVFERFQNYFHDLGTFFELWDKFKSPIGTKKASLTEEKELYEIIRGTEIEARFSMMDLYGFLHLPFSSKEHELKVQWLKTIEALVEGKELPEPNIKKKNLEELELTYKAIGLHLLFLYRLERQTEAYYWERLREEISDEVHEHLKREVKHYKNRCKRCGKNLPFDFPFPKCDTCHFSRFQYEDDHNKRR